MYMWEKGKSSNLQKAELTIDVLMECAVILCNLGWSSGVQISFLSNIDMLRVVYFSTMIVFWVLARVMSRACNSEIKLCQFELKSYVRTMRFKSLQGIVSDLTVSHICTKKHILLRNRFVCTIATGFNTTMAIAQLLFLCATCSILYNLVKWQLFKRVHCKGEAFLGATLQIACRFLCFREKLLWVRIL